MNNPYVTTPYKIVEIKRETEIDWTFKIEYSGDIVGGQFMQVSIPGAGEAPISISDFDEKHLYMTIRKVGRLTDVIFNLTPGDDIYMRGPYGNGFDKEEFLGEDILVVAGGTGVAPVKNTLKFFLKNQDKIGKLNIVTGFKSSEDILYKNEVKSWQEEADYILTVDQGDDHWNGHVGLVTEFLSEIKYKDVTTTKAIVVGPPLMMKFTTLELLKLGFKEENITVSFERKMSCGIGKCGHCKIDETYVCLEGPVFNYTKAKELLD